jgi:hypothetical protein
VNDIFSNCTNQSLIAVHSLSWTGIENNYVSWDLRQGVSVFSLLLFLIKKWLYEITMIFVFIQNFETIDLFNEICYECYAVQSHPNLVHFTP